MNSVASTIPGTAKMIWMSRSASHGPKKPCPPNSRTKTSPETTGETANGRSMRVTSTRLPGKSNRAIVHAAATPNTRFSGTTQTAVNSVRRTALSASGSVTARQYTVMPSANACVKTAASGTKRNSVRKASATVQSSAGTTRPPLVPGRRSMGLCIGQAQAARRRLHA